jgi:hypothetical protein
MRTLRTYSSSAEALGDVVVLESQGIESSFKGGIQGDAHQVVTGSVELQVEDDHFANAERLLGAAERERVERYVASDKKKKKTPGRYLRIALVSLIPVAVLLAWKTPFLGMSLIGCFVFILLAGGVAAMIGLACALVDL